MKRKKLTKEDFIERSNKIYNNKYDYSEVDFVNGSTKVKIICPIHGPFWQIPNDHVRGCGCKKCAKQYSMTNEEFIEAAKTKYGGYYTFEHTNFISYAHKVTITCPKHGDFEVWPQNFLKEKSGCPKCKYKTQHSIYEKICNAFPQLNIIYETGKVDWLQGLRFDIYIPELNIAIEYDGEQHFVPVEKFGGEIALKETQKRDRLKEELCDQNNCILIRISCYNK